ncbi:helix-turn-helix domain-containing protein [Paenibacillus marchantiophytorum]|uniref:helix-turn-helix domain-containing protein n=1 Tax=Paenibacillus marchantiophytorum TaxID=1619310 RepID=UPI001667D8C8
MQEKRLQFAHRLLLNSSLPMTEIGLASGFNSLSYFISFVVLKANTGCPRKQPVTPNKNRKSCYVSEHKTSLIINLLVQWVRKSPSLRGGFYMIDTLCLNGQWQLVYFPQDQWPIHHPDDLSSLPWS